MNYIISRLIIISVIILFFLILKIKFFGKITLKKILPFIIIILFVLFIPFDSLVFKFSDLTQAFHYYIPTSKIIKKYQYDDYAFIIYKNPFNSTNTITYLTKEHGNWKIKNISNQNMGYSKRTDFGSTTIVKIPNSDAFAVEVTYATLHKKDKNIYDSLSSDINVYYVEENNSPRNSPSKDEKYLAYLNTIIIIFDEKQAQKVDDNYTLHINGKDYKILPKMK